MRITIVSCVFTPEPVVSARMSQELSSYLAQKGARVTVICPQPSRPPSADYRHYRNLTNPISTYKDDIKVVRLPSFTAINSKLLSRAWESYSFGRHVCNYLAKEKENPNVLYVNSWPMVSHTLIARFALHNEIPLVLQIMDVYPESFLLRLSAPLRRLIAKPMIKLDRWNVRKAAKVIVISENMRQFYLQNRKIPPEKVVSINIWQDESLFEQLPSRQNGLTRYGVQNDRFSFLYLGNIGPVAGVDFLIQAFNFAAIENTQLLIVGDGSAKDKCVKMVDSRKIPNVRFISDPDVQNVPLIQSMSNVCLLAMKRGAGMSSIPSKLAAYMFSAKPVLAAVDEDSDTARAILQAKGGWVSEPENIEKLAAKMKEVVSLSNIELEKTGRKGQEYGFLHFTKSKGVSRLTEVILEAGAF
jgi:glycosyltransferase involved in cell wall biosynthesis